ncbi:nucleotide exchange factor GrpE [Microbacterium sp. W4I20]|uniref:nucleotide exchange factor GrpE n=1 Tax=Microbacterium sp. W4I20 TaxID=3042262 RepID=UPI0027886785|nr:nucleotide exchange factor GrpE [Microbacterium sp. W4I20]MDQ0727916.1 molecular chaperone GrpE [Microbacterium sp. W4I20]
MTDKNFDNGSVPEPDEGRSEGSDAQASGPAPQNPDSTEAAAAEGSDETPVDGAPDSVPEPDEGLTVDDILGATQTGEAAAEDAVLADLESTLLNDLKRLQAEYANYRRRTEEQRQLEADRAKGEAAKGLIPVLDDLDRAAQHGDLVEGTPFAVIAEKVRVAVERLGVVSYGEKGEVFDPQRHEAIFQQPTPGTTETTVLEVVEVGYRLGDIELRPAKVVVAVPAE